MISVIITTRKEPQTLKKSLDIILEEIREEDEVLVVGPDKETEKVVQEYHKKHLSIRYLKDEGRGKPVALNLVFQKARGEILVLTDGDVWPEKNFLKKLLEPFRNPKVGAITGRPISISPRNTILGYWSHLLTDAAHQRRSELFKENKYLDCSGYLYAIRKPPITSYQLPVNALSEDAYVSQLIWQRGYKIAYAPEVKIYVKYPDNFKDWLLQKRRSTGGYIQKLKIKNQKRHEVSSRVKGGRSQIKKMRSFLKEFFYGTLFALTYPKNFKESWWTILLFGARLYLWILILWDHKILRKKFEEGWERVESTK